MTFPLCCLVQRKRNRVKMHFLVCYEDGKRKKEKYYGNKLTTMATK